MHLLLIFEFRLISATNFDNYKVQHDLNKVYLLFVTILKLAN
jgi:hypothetical protein